MKTRIVSALAVSAVVMGLGLVQCAQTQTVTQVRSELVKKRIPQSQYLQYLSDPWRTTIGQEAALETLAQAITRRDPVRISGTGLVVNLKGTGVKNPPTQIRRDALKALVQHTTLNSVEAGLMIKSPNSAIVRADCFLNRAHRAGDKLDVYLTPIDGSTSLEGGILLPTRLYVLGLHPKQKYSTKIVRAKGYADAEGVVVTRPYFPKEVRDMPFAKGARVEEGATLRYDWNIIGIAPNDKSARFSLFLEFLLNSRFSTPLKPAVTRTEQTFILALKVPDNYMDEWERFFFILYNMDARVLKKSEIRARLDSWTTELHSANPSTRYMAACKLVGLGGAGVNVLDRALNDSNVDVQLEAAAALAPLGRMSIFEPLSLIAHSSNQMRKLRALAILARLKSPTLRGFFEPFLDDAEPAVVFCAAKALAAIGSSRKVIAVPHKNWTLIKVPAAKRPLIAFLCQAPRKILLAGDVRITGAVDLRRGMFRIRHEEGSELVVYSQLLKNEIRLRRGNSLEELVKVYDQVEMPFSEMAAIVDELVKKQAVKAQLKAYLD